MLVSGKPPMSDPAGSVAIRLNEFWAAALQTWGLVPGAGKRAIYAQWRSYDNTAFQYIVGYGPPDYNSKSNATATYRQSCNGVPRFQPSNTM